MKKVLINIDYTNDFVHEKGNLTCGLPGQKISAEIIRITEKFIQEQEFVVFAIDGHNSNDVNHPESRLFPPHNIFGTWGRELFGELKEVYEKNKENEQIYWLDKTRYSAFAGTDLEIKLRERGINEIHLVGVCTDICVLHTAVDGYNKGFAIVIHENAVASFNQLGHEWALGHFKGSIGAQIL